MLTRDEDILKAAEDWRRAGRGVALATVVETWGSAPRPVGSHLVIDDAGNFEGSVSGGCVEGAVVEEALDVIATDKPKMLEFGVADREHFIDDEDVGFHVSGDGEGEPHVHATRIALDRGIQELFDSCEGHYLVELACDLTPAHAENRAVEEYILSPRELWMKTGPNLKER